KRSGVSQRLPITLPENVVSNAERRALLNAEPVAVPRVSDRHAALPSITGKLEPEYEGELRGAAQVASELIRQATGVVFDTHLAGVQLRQVVEWFDMGGSHQLDDGEGADALLDKTSAVQGLVELTEHLGIDGDASPAL